MLLEKMAFSYARKRVSRSKVGGMFCKLRVKFCGSYVKNGLFFSKTSGDDSLRIGIIAPDEWRLSDRFVGGVLFYFCCLLLWVKFVFKNYSYFVVTFLFVCSLMTCTYENLD